jgi:hypothetical protein
LIDVASALETLESTLNPRSRNFIFLLADPLPHFCVGFDNIGRRRVVRHHGLLKSAGTTSATCAGCAPEQEGRERCERRAGFSKIIPHERRLAGLERAQQRQRALVLIHPARAQASRYSASQQCRRGRYAPCAVRARE